MDDNQPPLRPPHQPPFSPNNQTWEAAAQVIKAWRMQAQAGFYAASVSQQLGTTPILGELAARESSDTMSAVGEPSVHLSRLSVVQFGEVIPEGLDKGRIVEMVTLGWFELTEKLLKDREAAYQVPPEVWEDIVAGKYKAEGWDVVIRTPRSGDFGRDIIATTRTKELGVVRIIDQVKRYTPPYRVSADQVRAILGVLDGERATKAFVTTTSDFAPGVWTDPIIKPSIPNRLKLITGDELFRQLGGIIAARKR